VKKGISEPETTSTTRTIITTTAPTNKLRTSSDKIDVVIDDNIINRKIEFAMHRIGQILHHPSTRSFLGPLRDL
jgi:hypothetical protein